MVKIMEINSVKEEIREILLQTSIIPKDTVIMDDTLLSDFGLDSVGIVELIINIEEKYSFEFMVKDLDIKNFATITSISLLVHGLIDNKQELI